MGYCIESSRSRMGRDGCETAPPRVAVARIARASERMIMADFPKSRNSFDTPISLVVSSALMRNHAISAGELADELNISIPTLARWRANKRGPKWIRVGRSIRYRRDDIYKWLKQRELRKPK